MSLPAHWSCASTRSPHSRATCSRAAGHGTQTASTYHPRDVIIAIVIQRNSESTGMYHLVDKY